MTAINDIHCPQTESTSEAQQERGLISTNVPTGASINMFREQSMSQSSDEPSCSVMIVTKARDNSLVANTNELTRWLLSTPRFGLKVGVNVYVDEKLRSSKRSDAAGILAENPQFEKMLRYWTRDLCQTSPGLFRLVIELGGDGTVLFASSLFQDIAPRTISFSLGPSAS